MATMRAPSPRAAASGISAATTQALRISSARPTAAAESAIGLAILVVMFRNLDTINVEDLDRLKG